MLLKFACLGGSDLGKLLGGIGINDAARGVDDESAVGCHAVAAYLLKATALCSYSGHEEEVVGHYLADVAEEFALGGSDNVHELFF